MKQVNIKAIALIAALSIGSWAKALVFTIVNDTDKKLDVKAHGYLPGSPFRPNFVEKMTGKKYLTFGKDEEVKIKNWALHCLNDIEVRNATENPNIAFHEVEIMGITTSDSEKIDAAVEQLADALKEWDLDIGDDINLLKKKATEQKNDSDEPDEDDLDLGNGADEKKLTVSEVMKVVNSTTSLVGATIQSARTLRQLSRCRSRKYEVKLLPDEDSPTGWKWYATYLIR